MPLVKVEAADDYLDVAHLAEDKKGIGSGGAKRRLAGMIAPRYLARDAHARPRDVQVAGPYDSAASLDDNVSVITLETCLRQMEASGTSVWPWRRPWQNRTPKCREEEEEEEEKERVTSVVSDRARLPTPSRCRAPSGPTDPKGD